mmetsp:Transcript_11179/g.21641  ORF Transcript_11179/g.21641 Transcript_11179/m.21641 type:complete len:181 (-) Transcript_11179:122-664(-)
MAVLLSTLERVVVVSYLAFSLFAAVFMDAQSVLPVDWFPFFFRELVEHHAQTNHDPLVGAPEKHRWFQHLVYAELFFQVPVIVLLLFLLLRCKDKAARKVALVFSAHIATTMIPVLGFLLEADSFPSEGDRRRLIAIYLPFLLVPCWMIWIFFRKSGKEKNKIESSALPERTAGAGKKTA